MSLNQFSFMMRLLGSFRHYSGKGDAIITKFVPWMFQNGRSGILFSATLSRISEAGIYNYFDEMYLWYWQIILAKKLQTVSLEKFGTSIWDKDNVSAFTLNHLGQIFIIYLSMISCCLIAWLAESLTHKKTRKLLCLGFKLAFVTACNSCLNMVKRKQKSHLMFIRVQTNSF